MGQIMWIKLYGSIYVGPILWDKSCGPNFMGQEMWTSIIQHYKTQGDESSHRAQHEPLLCHGIGWIKLGGPAWLNIMRLNPMSWVMWTNKAHHDVTQMYESIHVDQHDTTSSDLNGWVNSCGPIWPNIVRLKRMSQLIWTNMTQHRETQAEESIHVDQILYMKIWDQIHRQAPAASCGPIKNVGQLNKSPHFQTNKIKLPPIITHFHFPTQNPTNYI